MVTDSRCSFIKQTYSVYICLRMPKTTQIDGTEQKHLVATQTDLMDHMWPGP